MQHRRRSTYPLVLSLVLAGVLGAWPALAHQHWLAPNFFVREAETAWLSFDHTYGDQRFMPDSGPGAYFQWWIISPDGKITSVPFLFLGKTRTVGEVEITQAGTYRIEAEEANMVWTKIKVDGTDTWQPGPRRAFQGKEIVESKIYFSKAMAYVTLGENSEGALKPTGAPLELVFEEHPQKLQATKEFQVTLLSLGKPVAAQEIKLFADQGLGHDPTTTCTTDTSGRCKFVAERSGRYLLTARLTGPTPDDPETDGFSYSLSVMVKLDSASGS